MKSLVLLRDSVHFLTEQNTQGHIQEKIVEKAKAYLTATSLSVSEIVYRLGFGNKQSFNKIYEKRIGFTFGIGQSVN